MFGYSDEDGTEAVGLDGHLGEDEIQARAEHVSRLAEELTAQRAEERIGERVDVLLESVDGDTGEGRAHLQGPEVDGSATVTLLPEGSGVGDIVPARVAATTGVDLVATAVRQ